MLLSTSDIFNATLAASKEFVGVVDDFYFDDQWNVRYLLVLESGSESGGKLISPLSLSKPVLDDQSLHFVLAEAERKPQESRDAGLSPEGRPRRRSLWPGLGQEQLHVSITPPAAFDSGWGTPGDTDIRSAKEMLRYHIQASMPSNQIEDFITETDSWIVQYMVLGVNNWLPGRTIWVRPNWVDRAEYDAWLYDYYGRPKELCTNST